MDKQQLQQTQLPIDIYQKTQAASTHQQQKQASYSAYQPTQTIYSTHQQKQSAYDVQQNNLNQTTNIAEHMPSITNQKQNQQPHTKKRRVQRYIVCCHCCKYACFSYVFCTFFSDRPYRFDYRCRYCCRSIGSCITSM